MIPCIGYNPYEVTYLIRLQGLFLVSGFLVLDTACTAVIEEVCYQELSMVIHGIQATAVFHGSFMISTVDTGV